MMLYNLKSALKYLWSSRKFTFLNVTGLALGLSITIMMVMLIHYELSFDSFHPNRDEILQIVQHDLKADDFSATCPLPLPSTILDEFPEVKHISGIQRGGHFNAQFTWQDREYSGFSGASVDPGFFEIFGYELLVGNPEYLLEVPDQIVVSEKLAQTIFGELEALGQTITLRDHPFIISGIFQDVPDNSSVRLDILFSEKVMAMVRSDYKLAWWDLGMEIYVILQPGQSVEAFEKHLQEIPDRHYPDFLKGRSTFITRPFKGAHFDTLVRDYNNPPVPIKYLFILGSITLITLIIASINYINLSTAQSVRRNIDSGIRRVLGAGSGHVLRLHLLIAYMNIFISLVISIVLCQLLMPFIESLTQRPLSGQFLEPSVWLAVIGAVVVVGFLTGFIPGRTFVKAEPVQMIRSKGSPMPRTKTYRDGMVILQFTLTLILITSQLFMFKQISFMQHAELGFNNENLLAIHVNMLDDGNGEAYNKAKIFRAETEPFGAEYGFSEGTITENIPGYYYQNRFTVVPTEAVMDECLVISTAVDEQFTSVYDIDVLEGRFFSWDHPTDQMAFMINETAREKLGWASIDGQFLKFHHEGQPYPVVGIMRDIHTTTLREPIQPMVYRFGDHNNFPGFITYRISPGKRNETIDLMEKQWSKLFPDLPFIHFDVKERYYENYAEEKRISRIIGSFTLMTILLSMLGLFGLVSFLSEQRQKEIGIRKVNGARTGTVMLMMNMIFIKWLGLAFLISWPIAWFGMQKWLQGFAYRTPLSFWVFFLAGFLALGIALFTVSWQSWRAASRNPVKSLRYE